MIAFVYGTTAELIKIAPVYHRLVASGATPALWCTGQQLEELPEAAERLNLPAPDRWLAKGVNGRSLARPGDVPLWLRSVSRHARRHRRELEAELWSDQRPPLVLVHGDTMTTVIGAVLGRWLGATVGHIEAGLRSDHWLQPFPEELDRRAAAVLAHIHFAPGIDKIPNLRRVRGVKVDTIGNTVLDSLRLVPEGLDFGHCVLPASYGVALLHRFELINNRDRFAATLEALEQRSRSTPIMVITDPVASAAIEQHDLAGLFDDQLVRLGKVAYFDFITLLRRASFVVTDSGGLQEECAYLNIPCLVHRATTERPDGLGRNVVLSAFDIGVLNRFLENPDRYRSDPTETIPSPSDVIVGYLKEAGYLGQPATSSPSRPELSVIVPAYREADIIRSTLNQLVRDLDRSGLDYEVIVVSDGSKDGTQYEARQVESPRLRVLHYADNAGKGFAFRYGFAHSAGSLVAVIDADMALSPAAIERFVKIIGAEDADVVVGSKVHPSSSIDMPQLRRLQMRLFGALIRRLFSLPLADTQTGVKVYRREVLEQILPDMRTNGFAFDIELLAAANDAGFRLREGPVEMSGRLGPVVKPSIVTSVLRQSIRLALIRRHLRKERTRASGPLD
ncbi:MAG TPA: UDP-N-acetylglucosamine 2-epimerase [Acidimicrobiales bacterium]|nr:UDP-N-acetylglucosamine 2-epimerase [Acidimicrobiales bacterium]